MVKTMETRLKKRIFAWSACFLLAIGMATARGAELEPWAGLEDLLFACSDSMDDGIETTNARDFAKARGFSESELAEKLVALVESELKEPVDSCVAACAIGRIAEIGRETEREFLREVMRTARDGGMRQEAFDAGIRMKPDAWEEWLREMATIANFGDLDRYVAYRNVFWLGRDGDEKTRQRVIEVLSEMRGKDAYPANRDSLGKWVAELKGGDAWEAWVKEVFAGEGFNDAAKRDACELAMQAGRNGDAKTRQRVIEVFGELCDDESLDVDRAALRRWIVELEDKP